MASWDHAKDYFSSILFYSFIDPRQTINDYFNMDILLYMSSTGLRSRYLDGLVINVKDLSEF